MGLPPTARRRRPRIKSGGSDCGCGSILPHPRRHSRARGNPFFYRPSPAPCHTTHRVIPAKAGTSVSLRGTPPIPPPPLAADLTRGPPTHGTRTASPRSSPDEATVEWPHRAPKTEIPAFAGMTLWWRLRLEGKPPRSLPLTPPSLPSSPPPWSPAAGSAASGPRPPLQTHSPIARPDRPCGRRGAGGGR